MIGILLNDNAYEQDIRELLMAFYPGETFVHEEQDDLLFAVAGTVNEARNEFVLEIIAYGSSAFYGFCSELLPPAIRNEMAVVDSPIPVDYDNRFETKNRIKRRLYLQLMSHTGKQLPWGTLTGIRPAKIAMTKLEQGMTKEAVSSYMKETYFTSDEKIALSIEIAQREMELLKTVDYENGYSLYLGIPFCPTTCLYCSFTSYPIAKWQGKTHLYLDALFREMDYVAERKQGQRPDTIYLGGGTPTSLSAEDLDCLLTRIRETFDCSKLSELTVEAGRPDSITKAKLLVLKRHGVTRISINPQTMKQETLDLIGRRHTVGMVRESFYLARELGFDNINMDLIIGLPGETIEDVRETLAAVTELSPDSLTIHSLAIKRAARLNTMKDVYKDMIWQDTQEMITLTADAARAMGMEPYYLYRQKNMAGNFENVGYAVPGKACIYNILIMEEKQTILACGAGTTTKILFPRENRLERVENVKDAGQYIDRIEEMLARKEALLSN